MTQPTTRADLHELVERVARLEEAELARNLLHAYAEELDDPTPEVVAALFSEAGTLSVPSGDFVGHEAIAGFYRDRFGAGSSEKRHFLMNVRTSPQEPGLVEVASYFLFTARDADASGLGWGTYVDLIEISEGVALFRSKTITPHVNTDLVRGWAAAEA